MNIHFKRSTLPALSFDNINRRYVMLNGSIEIGVISFIKHNGFFCIGFIGLSKEFQNKGYGYAVIEYILSQYHVKCIIGQTLFNSTGFWKKCIYRYNGCRRNVSTLNNCSSSFVIPKYKIDRDELWDLLELTHEIE